MGRSCDAEHFVYRDVYGAVTRLRELRIGAAVVWERRDLLVTARFKQSGYESEVSLLDLMLQFGSENIVKELVNFGVTVLQPEQIAPSNSLTLITKVAAAILDASGEVNRSHAF